MQKVIIENGQTRYIDLTPKEEADVMARVLASAEEEQKEKLRLDKIQQAKDKIIQRDHDLAVALGWIGSTT